MKKIIGIAFKNQVVIKLEDCWWWIVSVTIIDSLIKVKISTMEMIDKHGGNGHRYLSRKHSNKWAVERIDKRRDDCNLM